MTQITMLSLEIGNLVFIGLWTAWSLILAARLRIVERRQETFIKSLEIASALFPKSFDEAQRQLWDLKAKEFEETWEKFK